MGGGSGRGPRTWCTPACCLPAHAPPPACAPLQSQRLCMVFDPSSGTGTAPWTARHDIGVLRLCPWVPSSGAGGTLCDDHPCDLVLRVVCMPACYQYFVYQLTVSLFISVWLGTPSSCLPLPLRKGNQNLVHPLVERATPPRHAFGTYRMARSSSCFSRFT